MEAQPLELVIGNIMRRILFIIREEHAAKVSETPPPQTPTEQHAPPHQSLSDEQVEEQLATPVPNLRTAVMEAIGDLQQEVRQACRMQSVGAFGSSGRCVALLCFADGLASM